MSLLPLGNRVIIKIKEKDEKSAGGVFIPQNVGERPKEGSIIARGEDVRTEIQIGTEVLFSKYAGSEHTENGEELLIISAEDILAVRTS